MSKRIYLSGPMTGLPDYNFPAFHAAAAELRACGYTVANPAEINPTTDSDSRVYLREDIKALVDCDHSRFCPAGSTAVAPNWNCILPTDLGSTLGSWTISSPCD